MICYMKQYKIIEAKNSKEAEDIMNKMAQDGWRVISNTYWVNFKTLLVITFEKDV